MKSPEKVNKKLSAALDFWQNVFDQKGCEPSFCEFVFHADEVFWAMLKVPLHCRASQGVLSNEAFLSKASYLLLCIFPTPPLPRLCLNTCICVCVVFVFVLYLCLCCICISIFTDTVTSGCCQHLACLSPLTSPSWQRLHIRVEWKTQKLEK